MASKTNPMTGMTDSVAGPATAIGPPIEIRHDRMAAMQRAETEQRARLRAEKRVERVVPKIRPGVDMYVGLNGVGTRIPFGRKVMLPESIAALVDVAVAAHYAQESQDG